MNRVALGLTLLWMIVVSGGRALAQDEAPAAKKMDIAGEWTFKSGKRGAEDVPADRFPSSITITNDVITIPAAADVIFKIKYTIDASKSPAEIDLEIIEGPAENSKAKGIIKVADGLLTLCYDPTGEKRPAEFEATDDNWFFLFVLVRAAEPFDPAKLIGVWEIVSGLQAGTEMEDSRLQGRIQFTRDAIRIPPGDEAAFIMSYAVDASQNPATIDMELLEGPQSGAKAAGIVKFVEGNLVLCYDFGGQGRPTEFKSTSENGFFLFELKPAAKR